MTAKRAILTIVIGDRTKGIWELTRASVEAYADKIGADLIVMSEKPEWCPSPHWLKFSIHEFLHKKYDRLIYMDADMIIRPDCPDLFKLVPESKIGLFNEGKFTPRAICLHEVKAKYQIPLEKWDGQSYYNTGVMVISQDQRHVFAPPEDWKPLRYAFAEQTFLNYRIFLKDVPVYELPYRFNRMSIMNKHLGVSRLDSYIVHYAGEYDLKVLSRIIPADIKEWQEKAPGYAYEPTFYINVSGGLGDQICAEPSLRWISEVSCPKAEIFVLTNYPELFSHLRINAATIVPAINRPAIYEIDTHPSPKTPLRKYVSHHFTHPVDYISTAILRRTLPNEAKQIRLTIPQEARESVQNYNPDVLIHPGRGWKINTFPVDWWNRVIWGLRDKGLIVGIVGKNMNDEHGVLPVDALQGAMDLRDKLNLFELLAMIEKTPVLVTNDSSPVHLAGAFDRQIVLIPTCKHPDNLLPFRKGRQDYKARAVYRRILEADMPLKPMTLEWSPVEFKGDVRDYLPTPEEVILVAFNGYISEAKPDFIYLSCTPNQVKIKNKGDKDEILQGERQAERCSKNKEQSSIYQPS